MEGDCKLWLMTGANPDYPGDGGGSGSRRAIQWAGWRPLRMGRDDAAYDRAIGIRIAAGGNRPPDRVVIIPKSLGDAPDTEMNGVRSGDFRTIAQN